jgi:hypothetical protein
MRRPLGLVGLGLATVVAIGLNVPAAGAESSSGLSFMATANAASTVVAGYGLAPTPVPASMSGGTTFTVPALKCGSATTGIAFGSFIFGSTATSFVAAGVLTECKSGVALFGGALAAHGKTVATTFTPKPGDVIVVSVAQSATHSSASIKDVTKGKSLSLSGLGAPNGAVIDGTDGLTNGTTALPVVNFGKATYSKSTEDGKTLKAAGSVAINMETTTHVVQILTSTLNTLGNGFTETWKHS